MAPPDLPVQSNRPVKTYKIEYEHYQAAQAFQATAALQKANTEIARLNSIIQIANRDYKSLQTELQQGQDDMRSMLAKHSKLKQKLREATAAGTARIADDERNANDGAEDGPPVPRAGGRAPVPGDDGDVPVPGAEGGAPAPGDDGGEAPGPGEEQDDDTDRELAGLEMQTAEAFEKYMRKYEAAASRPDGTSATK